MSWPSGKTVAETTALAKKTGILRGPLWALGASGAVLIGLVKVSAPDAIVTIAGCGCLLMAINICIATWIPVWRRDYIALCTEEVQKKALDVGRFGSDDHIIDVTASVAEPGVPGEVAAKQLVAAPPKHPILKAPDIYTLGPNHGGRDK